MKLIDADNFKKRLDNMQYVYLQSCYQDVIDAIDCEVTYFKEEHPEIQISQGEWIFDSKFTEFGNPYGTYKCDKCGGHSSNKYPFCFWCGADMRKGGV